MNQTNSIVAASTPAMTPRVRASARWCAGALVLLLPGSFVIVAVLWLCRWVWRRAHRQAATAGEVQIQREVTEILAPA